MIKDLIEKLRQYENGEMALDEQIALFQDLIDTGVCWKLQGHYGRTAKQLIKDGQCAPPDRSS